MNPQSQPATPSYTIHCRMNQEAAALERLCQVVRIRGFPVNQHLDICTDRRERRAEFVACLGDEF